MSIDRSGEASLPVQRLTARVDHADWTGRADRFLTDQLGLITRNQLQKRCVRLIVNGQPAKLSRTVRYQDVVEVELAAEEPSHLEPEAIPLVVIFENRDVVVINKPRGMVVHPGAGHQSGTLVNALLHHVDELDEDDDTIRPGVVHRLDRDTSGVVICAKHTAAKEALTAQFAARTVEKRYVALVKGSPRPAHGVIDGAIGRHRVHRQRFTVVDRGGKPALTDYRTLRAIAGYTLMLLAPRTGRTHQLRVHMAHLGTPIVGDPIYARRDALIPDAPLCLHALSLALVLPGEATPRTFTAPIPPDFRTALSAVRAVTVSGRNRG
ncbi:MAG: RluA family pseudouridine synthase [Spirochaetaceae bacterium]|nr:MAG: RluA family pseudouridine synthase [Spirochaetaceae bacterium]